MTNALPFSRGPYHNRIVRSLPRGGQLGGPQVAFSDLQEGRTDGHRIFAVVPQSAAVTLREGRASFCWRKETTFYLGDLYARVRSYRMKHRASPTFSYLHVAQ